MKLLNLIYFLLISNLAFFPIATKDHTTKNNPATELTDLKEIVFARDLRDWKNKRVDSLQMDIYYPTGATSDKTYPLLMFYHAGGFMAGNRFNVMSICDRFADEGFITVAIDYRTGYDKAKGHECESDSVTFNNAIYRTVQDANSAIRYLVSQAATYRIDTNWIFVAGSSAGGQVAYTQAYWSDSVVSIYFPDTYNLLGSLNTTGNQLTSNFTIKGVCSMWGALAHADALIDSDYRAIPCIIYKGQEDGGFPDSAGHFGKCKNMPYVYAGIAVYDFLVAQNAPAVFHYLPQADHPAYDNGFCVQQASCFFHAIMEGKTYSGKYIRYASSCP